MNHTASYSLRSEASARFRQLCAVIRVETKKILYSKQAMITYVLALTPIVILILMGSDITDHNKDRISIDYARRIYGYIYTSLILGGVVFLGSASIFTALFRGEILSCSMHYYLLAPLRRDILVLGKYLSGLFSAWLIFSITTVLCYLLLYLPFGFSWLISDLTGASGIGLKQIFTYVGITILGSIAYGSLFMATGLLFRNPFMPVIVIAFWEIIHFLLPPALKLFSIIHYLKGLLPIPLSQGPLAITVTPPSALVSICGILGLSLVSILITVIYLNRYEIRYTED